MHRMDSSFRWNDNDCVCVIPVKTGIHYKHIFSPLNTKEPSFIEFLDAETMTSVSRIYIPNAHSGNLISSPDSSLLAVCG